MISVSRFSVVKKLLNVLATICSCVLISDCHLTFVACKVVEESLLGVVCKTLIPRLFVRITLLIFVGN